MIFHSGLGTCMETSFHTSVASFKTKHGWVKNVIAKFVNSLTITLSSLYFIFLDMIVKYSVNSWY